VRETGDIVDRATGGAKDRLDAAAQPDRRVGRRTGDLGDAHVARAAVDRDDIGEGAAGIDPDAQSRACDLLHA
jgi:hypothetical protein